MDFHLLFEQIPGVLWATDRDLRFTASLGRGLAGLGLKPNQVVGLLLDDYLQGNDHRTLSVDAHKRALAGEFVTLEQTVMGRVFQSHVEPLTRDGRIIGTIGVAIDITDRKATEQRLLESHGELAACVAERTTELSDANTALRRSEAHYKELAESNRWLLMELDHRVRNNLAGLLSLVSLMRHNSRDVGTFADAMDSRLRGMAHVHHLLTERGGNHVDLRTLISTLLDGANLPASETVAVSLDGPPVEIAPYQTLPLAMILQEWLTNSCKYGAHTSPAGRLDITWQREESAAGPRLHLRWQETGGPPVPQPVNPSLGTLLVQGFARRELKGQVELRFPTTGADHLLDFPLQPGRLAPEGQR